MSLTNVFAFLFKVQGTDKLKSDLKEIDKETKNLVDDNKKLSDAEKNTIATNGELAQSALKVVAAYMGFKKIFSEVLGFAQHGENLYQLAEAAGVTAERLERYGVALRNYGGDATSVAATLAGLSGQLQDLKFGGGGNLNNVAIRYGLDFSGSNGGIATAEELLLRIAKRMQSLGTAEQMDLGRKLGLDRATIAWLRQGVQGVTADLEKAGKMTIYGADDIKSSRDFLAAMRDFQLALGRVWAVVARSVLPIFTKFFEIVGKITDYLSQHKGFILGFLGAIAAALGVIAVKSMIATKPFWIMLGALGLIASAVGLIIDDFITWQEGGESMIGDLIAGFEDFKNFLNDVWTDINIKFSEMIDNLLNVFSEFWENIKSVGENIKTWFVELWKNIIASFVASVDAMAKVLKYIPGLGMIGQAVEIGKGILQSTNTPLTTMTTNNNSAINNNSLSNSVNVGGITVNTTAATSAGIAWGIGDSLQNELKNLLMQNTSGAAI